MRLTKNTKSSFIPSLLSAAIAMAMSQSALAEDAQSVTEAITSGKAYGDVRLRYESVDQDNALKDASALTIRSRFGYTTGELSGLSAGLEFEDSRTVLGVDEYNNAIGRNAGVYSVVADPETTELDQGYLKYKRSGVTATAGRQVIALDNQRFVGHVGWRQDRQTFDGLRLQSEFVENLSAEYAYLSKRNRIFAEEADIKSKDHLFNVGYKTDLGKLSAYAYLLEVDQAVDNGLDTYGVRFAGEKSLSEDANALYSAEYATQESETAGTKYDADYLLLEVGASFNGVTAKVGYEELGSDEGNYGFSTPLATLHAFNGWTDQFLSTPNQGLVDTYLSVEGKVAGLKLAAIYHDFSADESAPGIDDFGNELDLLVAKKFNANYSAGLKYGMYSAGDAGTGKVDTDKAWLWLAAKF